jgi:hypothetical protein
LWCADAYYEPEESAHWEEAWTYVGECQTSFVATASIEGTLTLSIGSRRSLVSVEDLDESETNDLILSAQGAIEDAACTGFPADYICYVDITSLNDQPVARRLRASSQRKLLPGLFRFGWKAQVRFQTLANWSNAQELANSASTAVSNRLDTATANNSLAASLISKALTSVIRETIDDYLKRITITAGDVAIRRCVFGHTGLLDLLDECSVRIFRFQFIVSFTYSQMKLLRNALPTISIESYAKGDATMCCLMYKS